MGVIIGLTVKEILITGVKRAAFSNEAGIGTAAMAQTKPLNQYEKDWCHDKSIHRHAYYMYYDRAVILSTGTTPTVNGVVMTANAFESAMPRCW